MPFLKTSDTLIHYQDCGEGSCVVFLHGSGGNHLSWWQQVAGLSDRFRCVVPDLRGFGLSRAPMPPQDASIHCDDLLSLLDHLNIKRAHIIGQSVGGHYALRFALRYPDRVHGLVLADTLAGIDDARVAAAKRAAPRLPAALIDRALGGQFRSKSPHLTFLYRSIEQINHWERPPQTLFPPEIDAVELGGLAAPTLFIVGESDLVAPAAAVTIVATMVRGAKVRSIPESGHSPYFEQPEKFNQAILEFLSELN